MSRYPWARTFIKLARWFSLLTVLLGASYISFQAWKLKGQVNKASYPPNTLVADSLQEVSESLQKSINIIGAFQKSTGGTAIPSSMNGALQILSSYTTTDTLSDAGEQVEQAKADVKNLKEALVENLQTQLNDIISQLRAHAAALTPPNSGNSNSTPSPSPAPAIIQPSLMGLFDEDVTTDEAESRKADLQQIQDHLGRILQQTEKPENQVKIQSTIDELHRLQGLLAYLTVPAEMTVPTVSPPQDSDTASEPAPILKASEEADYLESKESVTEDAVTSKWIVDDKIDAAEKIIIQAQKDVIKASSDVASLYISFYEIIVYIGIASLIVAYLIQIAADILQAHIDNADNSFLSVNAPRE